ncbi:MAG: diguanylate cyclase, partial [Spirochaeta sp.]
YGTSGVVPVARSWLVENLRDPIATCLPSGVIIDSNRNFSTMFGSVIGSPAHIQAVLPNWEELISSMKDDHISHTFEFDDSEHLRWLEAGIAYMRRIKHSVYAVIFRDITVHIQDQQQLEQAVEETRSRLSEVNLLQAQLREQTIRDELTDLYNRRFWSGAIEREFALAQRSSYPLSIAMLDIDHFKSVNDTYGHRVGDGILLLLADLLRTTLRRSDLIFRFGGEEFVLVMPGVHAAEAKKRLDTLRRTVEAIPYHHEPFGEIRITVSIGIADIPSGGAEPNEILERADSAMYQAKEAGRNRVCTYE